MAAVDAPDNATALPAAEVQSVMDSALHDVTEHEAFEATGKDGRVIARFFLMIQADRQAVRAAVSPMDSALKCLECSSRASRYFTLWGPDGLVAKSVFKPEVLARPEVHAAARVRPRQGEVLQALLVSHRDSLGKAEVGADAEGNPWTHVQAAVKMHDDDGQLVEHRNAAAALHKYAKLMHTVLDSVAKPGIQSSLEVMEEALPSITHGEKLQHGLQWMKWVAKEEWPTMGAVDRAAHVTRVILRSVGRHVARVWDPVITEYHQCNNTILPALGSAHDVEALKSMLGRILCPTRYQQRTAAPTDTQLHIAVKTLGDMDARYMTMDDIKGWGAVVPQSGGEAAVAYGGGESSPAAAAFAAIATKPKRDAPARRITRSQKRAAAAVGFGDAAKARKHGRLRTVAHVIDALKRGLQVQVSSSGSAAMAYTTNLGPRVQHPFLWSYKSGEKLCDWVKNCPSWVPVHGVLPLVKRSGQENILFVGKNLYKNKGSRCSCFLSCFLSPGIKRTCGPAFHCLQRTWKFRDEGAPLAMGVGVCAKEKYGKLVMDIHVRSRGGPGDEWVESTVGRVGELPQWPQRTRSGL